MKRLAGRRCRRLEAIKPFPVIFPRPLEQDLDRVLHLVVRPTKRQANSARGIERREVLVSRVPGASAPWRGAKMQTLSTGSAGACR
jgi:hypothetical protein